MGDDERRDRNRATLQRFLDSFGSGERVDVHTEDFRLEVPFTDPPLDIRGRAEVGAYVAQAMTRFRFLLTLTEVHECVDPDQLVVEYVSDGVATTTGKAYANRYIGVYWFRDGRICHAREFHNPAIASAALS